MSEQDPFAGVAVFVVAARADSFTEAAKKLGLTKSAVGKSVTRLEERLGIKLFHRTTRLTRLTADGEAYLSACSTAIDEINAAQTVLSSNSPRLSGRLHMDMPVAFGRRVLLPLLMDIMQPHPAVSLNLTFTDATSDLLRDDVDLAIRFGALSDTSSLVARHLVTQERVICAAPGYLRVHGIPQTLEEVKNHRCVVGSLNGPPDVWFVKDASAERRLTPPATHQLSDAEAMVDAVTGGLGLAQLPISLLRDKIASGHLELVLGAYSTTVEVHAVWPRRAQLSPRVRYVVDQLVALSVAGRLD
jgi:DNA-binding transcriptional LysR family regulator